MSVPFDVSMAQDGLRYYAKHTIKMNAGDNNYNNTQSNTNGGLKKKRVCKACDSCRIKKTKCNGMKPCMRCIANNKICTYTERRRSKDKSYPAGYVELLETRLDILTRSLKKLFELSESGQDISFLRSETTGELSINKLINKLVDKEDLFQNQPVEWEHGTSLATNFENDEDYLRSASAEFAEHSRQIINNSNDHKIGKKGRGRYKRSSKVKRASSLTKHLNSPIEEEDQLSEHESNIYSSASSLKSPTEVKSEYSNGIEKLGFNIDLGPFNSGSALATAALMKNDLGSHGSLQLSDFESDEVDEDTGYNSAFSNFSPSDNYQYQFPSFDSGSSGEISPKDINNSISSVTSLDNLNHFASSSHSPFNDLSSNLHRRQASLPNPTLVSQIHTGNSNSRMKSSSPKMDAAKTNEMINQAIKTRQSFTEQPDFMRFNETSNASNVVNNEFGFNSINIEPSRISSSNGFDDLFMNSNNPVPYNV